MRQNQDYLLLLLILWRLFSLKWLSYSLICLFSEIKPFQFNSIQAKPRLSPPTWSELPSNGCVHILLWYPLIIKIAHHKMMIIKVMIMKIWWFVAKLWLWWFDDLWQNDDLMICNDFQECWLLLYVLLVPSLSSTTSIILRWDNCKFVWNQY